jgi:hypothetical protein
MRIVKVGDLKVGDEFYIGRNEWNIDPGKHRVVSEHAYGPLPCVMIEAYDQLLPADELVAVDDVPAS